MWPRDMSSAPVAVTLSGKRVSARVIKCRVIQTQSPWGTQVSPHPMMSVPRREGMEETEAEGGLLRLQAEEPQHRRQREERRGWSRPPSGTPATPPLLLLASRTEREHTSA